MTIKKTKKYFIISTSLLILSSYLFCTSKLIRTTLNEINSVEGKIKLTLVRIWGGDDTDDENQFFRMPMDIKISKESLVHILDFANHKIQVFDRTAHFKRTIGRRGKGPGDLLNPKALAFDNQNNIFVADYGNSRIQAFTPEGNYLYSFRTFNGSPSDLYVIHNKEIAIHSYSDSLRTRKIVSICDVKGNLKRRIGTHIDKNKSSPNLESIYFTIDKGGNIFVSYCATPILQKYSYTGKSLFTVNFEMPFEVPEVNIDPANGEIKVKGEKKERVSAGIAVDKIGRFYIVIATRPIKEEEKFFMVSDGNGIFRVTRKNKSTDYKTDRFRLLVFNNSGKIIASKKLNVLCENIYVHENHLFIIDTYLGKRISEYKISFDPDNRQTNK